MQPKPCFGRLVGRDSREQNTGDLLILPGSERIARSVRRTDGAAMEFAHHLPSFRPTPNHRQGPAAARWINDEARNIENDSFTIERLLRELAGEVDRLVDPRTTQTELFVDRNDPLIRHRFGIDGQCEKGQKRPVVQSSFGFRGPKKKLVIASSSTAVLTEDTLGRARSVDVEREVRDDLGPMSHGFPSLDRSLCGLISFEQYVTSDNP